MPGFEHNLELSVPKNISKYCVYTGHIFLLGSYVLYFRNQWLALVLGMLYITTILHWREPYKKGWIRTIDITMVWTTFVTVSYYIYYYVDPAYHIQCVFHFFIVMCAHCLNETLYYYQVTEQVSEKHQTRYPLLRYTYPNTIERENAYKRCVFTHCIFIHLWLSISILVLTTRKNM